MFGDQWICSCGTHNFFMRPKCRECGQVVPINAKVGTAFEVMAGVEAHNAIERAMVKVREDRR